MIILIVDDEQVQRDSLAGFFRKKGYKTLTAGSVTEAGKIIDAVPVSIIVTDYKMPDGNGIELLEYARNVDMTVIVILMTAYGTIETAVEAMKHGAYDYLQKPVDLDALEMMITRAVEKYNLLVENARLKEELRKSDYSASIIYKSAAMEKVMQLVGKVADSSASVLIQGETGTGKELVAKAIHNLSSRKMKPFVAFNVAALSETLLESELFGHEKGAFTGADKRRIGRFEQADGGTLFIDEIGEVSPKIQSKLLRVLQENAFERVGSGTTVTVDVRLLTATNRDLSSLIREKLFREDLLYRLNVVTIDIPPLRSRKEDIPLLAGFFLKKYAAANHKAIAGISGEAMSALVRYHFPGNVRELENIIERAVILCGGDALRPDDITLPASGRGSPSFLDDAAGLTEKIDHYEKSLLGEALAAADGNQSEAARRLRINERNLRYKIRKYGLK